MIEFPETVQRQWDLAESRVRASRTVRQRVERATLVANEVEKRHIRHEADLLFQQALAEENTPPLVMGTLAEWANMKPHAPTDLIDGVIKDEGVCTVMGPPESGKSTLALQMVHSLLTGDDWLGQEVLQTVSAAGIISYDMPSGLMEDWLRGLPGVNPDSLSLVDAYGRGNPLAAPSHRKKIVEVWKAMKVEVVMIDSFSASFFGSDQNDAAQILDHYREMKKFALTEVGAKALIFVVHSTEASPNKARGSSVHRDEPSTVVSGVKDDKSGLRRVQMEKYRAARGKVEGGMTRRLVGAPDSVTHLVEVDVKAMHLEGMVIPNRLRGAAMFSTTPPLNDPDTDDDGTGDEREDDL